MVHLDDVSRQLREGFLKLPSTTLTRGAILAAASDPQRNRRLDLACRYYALFGNWPLPMDDQSIELLKLRVRHAIEQVADDSFELSQTTSPMVYVLNEVWQRDSQAWRRETAAVELFSHWSEPLAC